MRISVNALARVALVTAIAAGCGATPESGAPPGALGTAADYEALPVVTPTYEAALCAEPERCALPQRAFGTVGANGDAVVGVSAEDLPPVVRVDGATGGITPIGRLGSGPGEYRIPGVQGITAEGEVLLLDMLGRRLLRYGEDGKSLETSQITLPAAMLRAASFGDFVDGQLHVLGVNDPQAGGDSVPVQLFALPAGGEPKALRELPVRLRVDGLGQMFEPDGIFSPSVMFVVRESGDVLLTRGDRLVVERLDSNGLLAQTAGFDLTGRPVTEADVQAYLDRMLSGNLPPMMREGLERQLARRAERHAAITELRATADGHLWLKRTPREAGDSVEWLVLDRELSPQRRVWLSTDDAVIGGADGRILIARQDDGAGQDGYWWARLP